MSNPTPIFADLLADHPAVAEAMTREPWSYAAALKAADEAIAARSKKKAPVKKWAPRRAS